MKEQDLLLALKEIKDQKEGFPSTDKEFIGEDAFINRLPVELKIHIVLSLPIKDWFTLRLVSSAWKTIHTAAAKTSLDSAQQHHLLKLLATVDSLKKRLIDEVEDFCKKVGGRSEHVHQLMMLNILVDDLQEPLAKLLVLTQRLNDIRNSLCSVSPFSILGPNSHHFQYRGGLDEIITPTLKTCNNLSKAPWFQNALACTKFCPTHPVAQKFSLATLEIEKRSKANEKPFNINTIQSLTETKNSLSFFQPLSVPSLFKIEIHSPKLQPNRNF